MSRCTQQNRAEHAADEEALLEELAAHICDRRLGRVAIFLLESLVPLNFIGSQVMHALGPLAGLVVEPARWERLAGLLEQRGSMERLIRKIEEREQQSSAQD